MSRFTKRSDQVSVAALLIQRFSENAICSLINVCAGISSFNSSGRLGRLAGAVPRYKLLCVILRKRKLEKRKKSHAAGHTWRECR